jgi:putative lipoprotein
VVYLQRTALPPDAAVRVRLDEVLGPAATGRTLAETTIPAEGQQVPLPFTLNYPSHQIDPDRRYVVHATIQDGEGTAQWTTESPPAVLTQGAPSDDVEVRVVPAADVPSEPSAGETAPRALVATPWRLIRIETSDDAVTPDADETLTIAFAADGRLGGQADCNRFFGPYTLEEGGGLTVGDVAGTRVACPPPSSGDVFLRVLGAVDSFELTGGRLHLRTGDGRSLTFEPASFGASSSP